MASTAESRACTAFPAAHRPTERSVPSSTAAVWHSTQVPPHPAQMAASRKPPREGGSRGVREKSSSAPVRAAPSGPPRLRKGPAST